MQKLIEKADVLIEALPYIQQFRGEIIVIKFGGSAMEEPRNVDNVLSDVTFMECVGMLPVIVHGGGKAISRSMKEQGIAAKFVKGLRVTCDKTIEIVQKVMQAEINPAIVSALRKKGAKAQGLNGEDLFKVVRKTGIDQDTGEILDWGFVGEPDEVDVFPIQALLKDEIIPVITPLGIGPDGKVHNINADTAAAAIAKALKARKLAYLSDVPGLLSDPKNPDSIIATLKESDMKGLIQRKVIDGGMLPKIESGIDALRAGVRKIHMIDGRIPHSLLLEIFTDKGIGTEILRDE
jgi:acetylglutamate kinase